MKYYEILYNSSQASRSGGAGLGVRAQSADIPEEYLALARPGAGYQKGKFRAPSIEELFADPLKIFSYPLLFTYRTVETAAGKRLYIFRRQVALEFDYSYYQTGKPTRQGNYAEHTLIFEERPDPSIFLALYEQPKPGSLAFRPVNRLISTENEEMRGYMLGPAQDFEPADRPSESHYSAPIVEEAYNLLFHLVEARSEGRSLVAVVEEERKPVIMGDLCRLLQEYALDLPFTCAYTLNFDPKSFPIVYVTEHNTAPVLSEMSTYIIRKAAEPSKSEAAEKYGSLLRERAEAGDSEALKRVVEWLLEGRYAFVKGASSEVSLKFLNYTLFPELFRVEDLKDSALLEVVARHHQGSTAMELAHQRMVELLRGALASEQEEQVASALLSVDQLKRGGLSVAPILKEMKEAASGWICASSERLVALYKALPVELFNSWIQSETLYERRNYLLEEPVQPLLMKLYRYFYPNPTEASGELLSKLLYKLEPAALATLLQDANPNVALRQECYLDTIAQNPAHVARLWGVLLADLGEGMRCDLFERFKAHWADEAFAPIFYYGFRNRLRVPLRLIECVAQIQGQNPAFKSLVVEGERNLSLYRSLFMEVAPTVRREEAQGLLEQIQRDLLTPLYGPEATFLYEWTHLYHLLAGTWTTLPLSEAETLYQVARMVGDGSYLREVALHRLGEISESQPLALKVLLQDLLQRGLLTEGLLVEALEGVVLSKQSLLCELYLELRRPTFEEAYALLQQLQLQEKAEALLMPLYEKEYRSFCRNQKIKGFFKGLFGGKKKEEKE